LKIRNAFEKPVENERKKPHSIGALEAITFLIAIAKDRQCYKSRKVFTLIKSKEIDETL